MSSEHGIIEVDKEVLVQLFDFWAPRTHPPWSGREAAVGADAAATNRGIEAIMRTAADAAKDKYGKPAQLLLVVLPGKMIDEYKEIKRVSYIELGHPFQVIAANKAPLQAKVGTRPGSKGGDPQYCANVAMKINNKLGGVNVTLSGGLK
ncbi:Protein argonaute-3 [Pleodorina starrii]|nr:Protein argonaute-3 [Pleodorina starrii]GLC66394.1 Protein argonaute-3 [Pleodorina starrii]